MTFLHNRSKLMLSTVSLGFFFQINVNNCAKLALILKTYRFYILVSSLPAFFGVNSIVLHIVQFFTPKLNVYGTNNYTETELLNGKIRNFTNWYVHNIHVCVRVCACAYNIQYFPCQCVFNCFVLEMIFLVCASFCSSLRFIKSFYRCVLILQWFLLFAFGCIWDAFSFNLLIQLWVFFHTRFVGFACASVNEQIIKYILYINRCKRTFHIWDFKVVRVKFRFFCFVANISLYFLWSWLEFLWIIFVGFDLQCVNNVYKLKIV